MPPLSERHKSVERAPQKQAVKNCSKQLHCSVNSILKRAAWSGQSTQRIYPTTLAKARLLTLASSQEAYKFL